MESSLLWIEKYQPKSLDNLEYNQDIGLRLKHLLSDSDFPHLLFYGNTGAGKRTFIHCLLRELYGGKVDKMKGEVREFEKGKTGKIECTVISSPCHIEVTPSEAGNNDKVIVQKLIKELAGSMSVTSIAGATKDDKKFKVVVINEVDALTKEAQAGLRRTMEKYMANCRILMNCQCISKVIEPLRSRSLMIRVPSPTVPQIASFLGKMAGQEGVTIGKDKVMEIALKSRRNMRRAIMLLQTMEANGEKGTVPVPHYELFCAGIATDIMAEQSPKKLKDIREKLYELLIKLVPSVRYISQKATTPHPT